MPHWKTTLTYDGTPYNGWQIQPSLPTVQGTLAQAIHRVTGETVLPQGSGRTDTGVHALAQVATFSLTVPIPADNLHRALNRALPPSIRILSLEPAPEDFHARYSARRKTYEYRILPCNSKNPADAKNPSDTICSPMLAPYVWACRLPLDIDILHQTAAAILGTHDFTSFAANDPDLTTRSKTHSEYAPEVERPPTSVAAPLPHAFAASFSSHAKKVVISTGATDSPIVRSEVERPPYFLSDSANISNLIPTDNTRTIFHSAWRQQDNLLIYQVTGSGFLHHMVRNLVGTFVEAAANRIPADSIPQILAARNRSAAGPTAPARGLFLVKVIYAEDEVES